MNTETSRHSGAQPLEMWIDARDLTHDALIAALHSPIDGIVLGTQQAADLPNTGRIKLVRDSSVDSADSRSQHIWLATDVSEADALRAGGAQVALRVEVVDGPTLHAAAGLLGRVDYLFMDFSDPTNIPLELLIAEAQKTGTRLIKTVANFDEAMSVRGVLESGPAGVLLKPASAAEIAQSRTQLHALREGSLELDEAVVVSARHIGVGFRGCVDCVTLFQEDEGMIVGSTSAGGLLVCAEVHYLPYMNLRPFRVNAGGVHSYVWAPDARTEYITDLRASVEVLAVSTTGRTRPVVVGRVKTEVRSLRMIEARVQGATINTIIQDDWHVRIFDSAGRPLNSTDIQVGTRLLAYVDTPGRHVGVAVAEHIVER